MCEDELLGRSAASCGVLLFEGSREPEGLKTTLAVAYPISPCVPDSKPWWGRPREHANSKSLSDARMVKPLHACMSNNISIVFNNWFISCE